MTGSPKLKASLLLVGVLVFIALLLMVSPFVIVDAGHKGVVVKLGQVQDVVLDEGFHWRIPILTSVKAIDVREAKLLQELQAYSKDTQTVGVSIAVNYRIDGKHVNQLYRDIGPDFEVKVLYPTVQEAVKNAVATYTAGEILEKRPELKEKVLASIRERVLDEYLLVSDVALENFEFSKQYEESIEAKQVAEQAALKAENDLKRVQFEAAQRVEQARAEAEAIKIQAEAITQQGGKDYVQLKAIEKWDGSVPTHMIPGATVPFINLTQ